MGIDQICLPRSRRHQKRGPGAQRPRPGGPTGGSRSPRWAGRCRGSLAHGSAVGPATPGLAGGAGSPAARKASVTITIAVRALRGGGTGNSDLSGPAAVAATAAFCVRSATAGNGRAPGGPSASSQRRRGRGEGHPSRRKGGRGNGQKNSLVAQLFLFNFLAVVIIFALKKKKKIRTVKSKKFFETSGWAAGALMSWDSGFQASSEKQLSPARAGAELCIAVKLKCLCLPLHTRSAGSVYISGSVFTVPRLCAPVWRLLPLPF